MIFLMKRAVIGSRKDAVGEDSHCAMPASFGSMGALPVGLGCEALVSHVVVLSAEVASRNSLRLPREGLIV